MQILNNVMLPVLLIFISGFIFQKIFHLKIKEISTVAIYLLLPFLVFQTFYKESLNLDFLNIVVISMLIMLVLIVLGVVITLIFYQGKYVRSAFLLATVFPNSGNYGVPIVLFAFGNKGLIYAMPIMVLHNILMGTIGVYIAANGKQSLKNSLKTVLRQPMNYVILPAILLQQLHINISTNFMKSINMIADTTIPIIMLILGMQLADVVIEKIEWKNVGIASFVRLIVSPGIAYVICSFFSINPLLKEIIIIMAAMPSAANTTLYAIQFDTKPQFVSSCTLVSTVASISTLAVLLNIIK